MHMERFQVDVSLTAATVRSPKMDFKNLADAMLTNGNHFLDLINDTTYNDFFISEIYPNITNGTYGNFTDYFNFYPFRVADYEDDGTDGSFTYFIEVTIFWDMII